MKFTTLTMLAAAVSAKDVPAAGACKEEDTCTRSKAVYNNKAVQCMYVDMSGWKALKSADRTAAIVKEIE